LTLRPAATLVVTLFAIATLPACKPNGAGSEPPESAPKTDDAPKKDDGGPRTIADVGFQVPESAFHDVVNDVYFVSNINGDPFGGDGKGFISRVGPDGKVLELKWIDGEAKSVKLNAPKGMAVSRGTLYVADVTAVRKFSVKTAELTGSITIEGATFLNDVTAGLDGNVYVSDTGMAPGFEPSGTDAIWKIAPDDTATALVRGKELGQPNGLLATDDGILMVSWTGGALSRIDADGKMTEITKLPENQLDGLVIDNDDHWLISSWAGKCVYRVSPKGEVTTSHSNLEAPADLGYDSKRGLVLVPWFQANKLDVLK